MAQTLESLRQEIASLNERYATALQLAIPADVASSRAPQETRWPDSVSTSPLSRPGALSRPSVNSSHSSPLDFGASRSSETVSNAPAPEVTERRGVEGEREEDDQEHESEEEQEEEQEEEEGEEVEEGGEEEDDHEREDEEEGEQEEEEEESTAHSQSSAQEIVLSPPLSEPGNFPDEGSSSDITVRGFPRQPTEGECPICSEDFANESILAWCRAQCGQNYHANCVYRWLSSQEDNGGVPSCPHW